MYPGSACCRASLIGYFNVPFYFGGTALLIVVGVALDTAGQIETHLLTRQYEGFLKKGRLARGGNRAGDDDHDHLEISPGD